MINIEQKLDLVDYIIDFKKLFARNKDIFLQGDINIHIKFINQLSKYNIKTLSDIKNLDNELERLSKQGVLKLYEIFEFIRIIKYFLYLEKFNFEDNLKNWIDKIIIPKDILDIVYSFTDDGTIKENVSIELDNTNNTIHHIKKEIEILLYQITSNKNLGFYLVDTQIHYINDEECLLLRGGFAKILKGKVINRSDGGYFYVVPDKLNILKQKLSDMTNQKDDILFDILSQMSKIFYKYILFLNFINKEFDQIDHYLSRIAFTSENKNFILPNSKSKINQLIDFCHPALNKPKPISVDFSKNILLITGVNAGGKTMMLKSILSAIYLSKNLIPYHTSTKTTFRNFKNILAILDDPQNIKNDISTFAGRMIEFSKLFNQKNTIIGVDEIELGTDSDEAASLFKVIVKELIKNDMFIIITTHHKRLASLLSGDSKVELVAALYDEELQKPKYEFLQGIVGRSYAFETALRYQIPAPIIKKAKQVYDEDGDKLNELIEQSTNLQSSYKQKLQTLNQEIERYKQTNKELNELRQSINKEIYTQKTQLHFEYDKAKQEANKAIKAKMYQQSHKHLNKAHKTIQDIKINPINKAYKFKVGDRITTNNTKGVILSLRGKRAFIQSDNGINLQTSIDTLQLNTKQKIPKQKQKITLQVQKPNNGHIKLDLHGKRVDEALELLDKFISDCLLNNFNEVLIYHGIGTGKLASVTKDFLKQHPRVISFSDGDYKNGGFGAKIIRF